jgi:prevent-host-death family protein
MAGKTVTATAGEIARRFSHFSDEALKHPVVVTKNGRPRNVILSFEDYERLRRLDSQAYMIEDLPDHLASAIENLAEGKH